jgi:diguanylate cyclase (GGDEF)-like protein
VLASLVGVVLLYVDQVLAVLAFAWLRRHLPRVPVWVALSAVLAGVLAFDTLGYIGLLFHDSPELGSMLVSGLVTKGGGGLVFGVVWGLVLSRQLRDQDHSINDLLGVLLFREDMSTLRRAAVTDELTGLYNRRSYALILDRMREQASAEEPFSLLLADADHFKQVNDRLGHAKGDEVIIAIANRIREATRGEDFCFRLGGDEFAVVLPKCGREGAREVALRVAGFEFEDEALDDAVTLTIGVAVFPEDAQTLDELFERADKRLYEGKELGRAQIVSQTSMQGRIPEDLESS